MRFSTSCFLIIIFIFLAKMPYMGAQTNGNMEAWSPSGSPPPFDWLYPTGWTTNNGTTEFITSGTKRSTDEHSGTYAAQMSTLNVFGTLTPSILVLGTAMLDFPNYSVKAHTGGEALTQVPTEVSFYYKLQTGAAFENALFKILIKRGNGSGDPDTVYHEVHGIQAVDQYTEARFPIPDVEIDILTDSIVLVFLTNNENASGINVLYVDDIVVDFASATNTTAENNTVVVYPNPVYSNQSFVVKAEMQEDSQVELFDLMGRKMMDVFFEKWKNDEWRISTNGLQGGLYTLRLGTGQTVKVIVVD